MSTLNVDKGRPAESDAGDVEALAGVLFASWTAQGTLYSPFVATRDDARTDAVAVLSSDWLAGRDAATADRARREGAVKALTKAGDLWQTGEWSVLTEAVKAPSQPQRVIGAAQAVTGWLRRLAEHTKEQSS